MDASALKRLEENARRLAGSGDLKKRAEAETVLEAIDAERLRRTNEERRRAEAAKADIAERVRDLALFDRAVMAFSEVPPADWEVEILRAVARNPGASGEALAQATGRSSLGYTNLAVGTVCSGREVYLATNDWFSVPRAERVYSTLIIDLTKHVREDGSSWHGWTLKPEVEAALRHLDII